MYASMNLHNVTGAAARIVHHPDGDSWLSLRLSTDDGGSLELTLFPHSGECTPEQLLEQLAPVGVQA